MGTLKVGTVSDLAAFETQEGEFQFHDVRDNLQIGQKNIQPVLTVRQGKTYRPTDVQEELDENIKRAQHMRALVSRQYEKLGWSPSRSV